MFFLAILLILHTGDGRPIHVAPEHITNLHGPKAGEDNRLFTPSVNCLINLDDGKFVSVKETCEEISRMIGKENQ